jgi:hypothetical protein
MNEETEFDTCGEEIRNLSAEEKAIKLKECRGCWYQARCAWVKELNHDSKN